MFALSIQTHIFYAKCYTGKNADYHDLVSRVTAGDVQHLEKCIKAHVTKEDTIASLRSRSALNN